MDGDAGMSPHTAAPAAQSAAPGPVPHSIQRDAGGRLWGPRFSRGPDAGARVRSSQLHSGLVSGRSADECVRLPTVDGGVRAAFVTAAFRTAVTECSFHAAAVGTAGDIDARVCSWHYK